MNESDLRVGDLLYCSPCHPEINPYGIILSFNDMNPRICYIFWFDESRKGHPIYDIQMALSWRAALFKLTQESSCSIVGS